jgi:hypothetical protein
VAKKAQRSPSFRDRVEDLKVGATKMQPKLPYTVRLTATAEATYLELKELSERAEGDGDPASQHCTTFRMVDEAIRILIPSDPTAMRYRLHKPLEDVYRVVKGRLRIAWMVNVKHRAILVMYLTTDLRKDGDKSDPYKVLTAMAKAGYLKTIADEWLKALETPPDAPIN